MNDLPLSACRLLGYLARRPSDLFEWWESTATIARKLGLSVRATQASLARLEAEGYIRLRRDKSLKSGRAIVMVWREPVVLDDDPESKADAFAFYFYWGRNPEVVAL